MVSLKNRVHYAILRWVVETRAVQRDELRPVGIALIQGEIGVISAEVCSGEVLTADVVRPGARKLVNNEGG